jgi:hypothetical protein
LGTGRPVQTVSENHTRIVQKINHLKEMIAQLREYSIDINKESPDYIEEKWSKKYKRSINCSNPRGFSQRAHCAGRKK